jgi:2-keto-myo-inositol isomerase
MLIGYNQATSLKHSSLEIDVAMCEKHGFYGLEMQTDLIDKYMDGHTLDDMRKLFEGRRVKGLPINALTNLSKNDENDARLRYLCQYARAAGAETTLLAPMVSGKDQAETAEVIRSCLATASEYGVRLALEFLSFEFSGVRSLEQALDIAGQAPGLKIVLDCFHIMAGPTDPDTILKLDPGQIEIVHVSDLPDKPSGVYSDADRVWPGKGDKGLARIFKNLKAIGYDGLVSVELFNEKYWELPIDEIYSTAMAETGAFLQSVL